jgi:hypothetical protein
LYKTPNRPLKQSTVQYLLPCPCGHSVLIARSQAGSTIVCSKCNTTLDIPTIRGMANLTPAVVEELGDSAASRKQSRSSNSTSSTTASKSTLRKVLTAVFFMVFVVAGLTTARWGVIRYFTPTPFTVEDEIKEGAESLARFTPADAWDAWQYYQSTALREKNPAPYYRIKRLMELQDENMRLGGIITAVAFASLMATIFLGRRPV